MTEPTLDGPHDEAEELLPWYVTGRLDAADRERVEKHLTDCARCQAQLRVERRLADEYRAYSPHVEASWTSLRKRIEPTLAKRLPAPPAAASGWRALRRPAIAMLMAAQLAIVVLTAGTVRYFAQPDPAYRALGSAPVAASANAVIVFQPQTREEQLRRLLNGSGAEVVGGPTDADAYVLHIAPAGRVAALAELRARPEVVMAEPIDGQTP
jgi:anti-sigma factor RsiW